MGDKPPKNIRSLNRYITTHNKTGQAIFSTALSEDMPVKSLDNGADFSLAYTSDRFPAQLDGDVDLAEYANYLTNPPGITISTGNVCRIVDIQPGITCAMHRTVSLDYGVVLEGEVELILDSGETRLLKRGDVAVQRGTNHAWRNATPDVIDPVTNERTPQWARMLYVLMPSQPMTIGGKYLGEVVDGIGARANFDSYPWVVMKLGDSKDHHGKV
ncbi:unnamed protein product [Penicillium pancosmium]